MDRKESQRLLDGISALKTPEIDSMILCVLMRGQGVYTVAVGMDSTAEVPDALRETANAMDELLEERNARKRQRKIDKSRKSSVASPASGLETPIKENAGDDRPHIR